MQPSEYIIPGTLKYVVGDATVPSVGGQRIIVQVNNDEGRYGAGLSGAISKRWPKVEQEYRRWHRSQHKFVLGEIQTIRVQSDTVVVNMIAQRGIKKTKKDCPLQYDALEKCLNQVGALAADEGASVHSGRFGAGLAGGDWDKVESLIVKYIIKRGISVTIYDLP